MKIGNNDWKIKIVDRKEIDGCDGKTYPNSFEIKIADDICGKARLMTFIHEVCHAILTTQGRCYQKKFDLEELCEFVSWTYEDIDCLVRVFLEEIGL